MVCICEGCNKVDNVHVVCVWHWSYLPRTDAFLCLLVCLCTSLCLHISVCMCMCASGAYLFGRSAGRHQITCMEHNAEETEDRLPVELMLYARMIRILPDVTVKEDHRI